MELGLIPKLEQFNFNSQQHVQEVSATNELAKLKDSQDAREIVKQNFLNEDKVEETSELKNSKPVYNEVSLTNLNFGYNDESKDFFVRVQRDGKEFQYPTQEMMKLKAYLMNLNTAS